MGFRLVASMRLLVVMM